MPSHIHTKKEFDTFMRKYGAIPAPISLSSANLTTLRSNILAGTVNTPSLGAAYQVTDGLYAGRIVEWNGVDAFNSSKKETLTIISKQSTTAVGTLTSSNTAADTTLTTLEEITIPGFLLGRQSSLRFNPIWGIVNSVATKNLNIYFYTGATGEHVLASNSATNASIINHLHVTRCLDSYNAQKTSNQTSYGNTGNSLLASGITTTSDFNVRFKASWGAATASETITLLGYNIELLP